MPVASATATPISREKLLQIARSLPADLNVLSKLGEMLQDINSELDQIAELLRRDVSLAARIVRISNSAVFGGAGQVASIEDAVNRVGFGEILKLVGTATAARFTERGLDAYQIGTHKLRDNMLYGAFAAEALARAAGADTRVAYTAGLLRPLGMMILDRGSRGHLSPLQHYNSSKWPNYLEWERAVFGTDSCEVAAMVLEEWRFPSEVSLAVRGHYLTKAADRDRPLAALLNLANALAHRVERSFPGEVSWWDVTPAKLQTAGVTEDDFEPAMVATEAAFETAIAAMAA
jgi:HD-like signal output (HDOD) protein